MPLQAGGTPRPLFGPLAPGQVLVGKILGGRGCVPGVPWDLRGQPSGLDACLSPPCSQTSVLVLVWLLLLLGWHPRTPVLPSAAPWGMSVTARGLVGAQNKQVRKS